MADTMENGLYEGRIKDISTFSMIRLVIVLRGLEYQY
jgi:hypothetical protein